VPPVACPAAKGKEAYAAPIGVNSVSQAPNEESTGEECTEKRVSTEQLELAQSDAQRAAAAYFALKDQVAAWDDEFQEVAVWCLLSSCRRFGS
jgi:hypothetical protein